MSISQLPSGFSLTHPSEGRKKPPTREFLSLIEGHAQSIRQAAGVEEQIDRFDPFKMAEQLGVVIMPLDSVKGLPDEARRRICALDARKWSGGAQPLPDGRLLVILNPSQTQERARVTLLEEVAHQYLKHEPSKVAVGPSGLRERSYEPAVEQEAYWTAGAVLLPALAVARAVYRSQSAEELSADYGTSIELAEMRIKILKLWGPYCSNVATNEELPPSAK